MIREEEEELPCRPRPPNDESLDLLSLIATLALEDVDQLQSGFKGKDKHTALSDEEIAFQLYEEEANSLLTYTKDAILACSIDQALRSDRPVIRQLLATEAAAARDRQIAIALSNGTAPPAASSRTLAGSSSTSNPSSELLHFALTDSEAEDTGSTHASSSNVALVSSLRSQIPAKRRNTCAVCQDEIRGIEILAPCGHYYDAGCLVDLFRSTINDESLFPPRCCQRPFVLANVRQFLGIQLVTTFQKKSIEFSTSDRVYCYRPTCSAFLGAATQKSSALQCSVCFANTCGHCKEQAHPARLCSSEIDNAVLALAEQEGWKRCPGCHRLVELTVGCYHMTCLCRKQFCYVCTETWKTCSCPQWEENRLFLVAEQRVNRQLEAQPTAPVPRAPELVRRMVRQEAERIRVDHHCAHTSWKFRSGAGNCEHCGNLLARYLLRCTGCQMLACVRCQRNRL